RVKSFSLTSRFFRAASHSACDTTAGFSVAIFVIMIGSPLSFLCTLPGAQVNFHDERGQPAGGRRAGGHNRRVRYTIRTHQLPPALRSGDAGAVPFGPRAHSLVNAAPPG